jgi:hypothetical protein
MKKLPAWTKNRYAMMSVFIIFLLLIVSNVYLLLAVHSLNTRLNTVDNSRTLSPYHFSCATPQGYRKIMIACQ